MGKCEPAADAEVGAGGVEEFLAEGADAVKDGVHGFVVVDAAVGGAVGRRPQRHRRRRQQHRPHSGWEGGGWDKEEV